MTPLESLVACGTRLLLDTVDAKELAANRALGATAATANPTSIADRIKTGQLDALIKQLLREGADDETLAWKLTDHLVSDAQKVFRPVWEKTKGDDGWVSFELDPLLEDAGCKLP